MNSRILHLKGLLPRALIPCGLLIGTACRDTTEPTGPGPAQKTPITIAALTVGKTVLPQSDAYIRSDAAHKNYGSNDSLRLQKVGSSGSNRILIAFSQTGIADSLAGDSLVSASLELTIKRNGNNWGSSGRSVAAHRMTRAWTEGGATWSCANDTNVGNNVADCPGNTWTMASGTRPYATTAVSQAVIINNQTGVVTFNVTADVRAFLAGQASNLGWLLKLVAETQTGTVVFHSKEGPTKPRLVLTMSQSGGVPAQAPNGPPAWMYSDTNVALSSPSIAVPFTKRIVVVEFHPGTPIARRDSAVTAVGATVVGGLRIPGGEGHYYLRIEDVSGSILLSAAGQLRSMPQVANAFVNVGAEVDYRRPSDGTPGWRGQQSWRLTPATVDPALQTWALSAINAPFAWGCNTGSTTTPVAIVDQDFRVSPQAPALFKDLQGMSRRTAAGNGTDGHGAAVAGILAAKGNNNEEMTGVLWDADVRLYDYRIHLPVSPPGAAPGAGFASPIAGEVAHAGYDGAKIINLSLGMGNLGQVVGVGSPEQQAARNEMYWALRGTVQTLQARGHKPLMVLSAGNDGLDAYWNAFPQVRDAFPDQVLSVGASTPSGSYWAGGNTGTYVDIAAPGAAVYTFTTSGAVAVADTGTSLAVPFVSGIAGLLLSFDPRLTTAELRQLILDGAQRSNRPVTAGGFTYYIADAYESLKLAAERDGAPVCGNRIWLNGDAITVQRRPGTDEILAHIAAGSGSGPETPSFLEGVYHGGHRIDYRVQEAPNGGLRSLLFAQGLWQAGAYTGQPADGPNGAMQSRMGRSHDADTIAVVRQLVWNEDPLGRPPTAGVFVRDVASGVEQQITTFNGFRANNGTEHPIPYAPLGNRVLVPIRPGNGLGFGVDVYSVDLATGQKTLLWSHASAIVMEMAISEDGKEAVNQYEVSPGPGCTLEYRTLPAGTLARSMHLQAASPSGSRCTPQSTSSIRRAQVRSR